MTRLGKYNGRTVKVQINNACSNEYLICDQGEYKTVPKSEIEITNQSSISLNELGSMMGISVTHL